MSCKENESLYTDGQGALTASVKLFFPCLKNWLSDNPQWRKIRRKYIQCRLPKKLVNLLVQRCPCSVILVSETGFPISG